MSGCERQTGCGKIGGMLLTLPPRVLHTEKSTQNIPCKWDFIPSLSLIQHFCVCCLLLKGYKWQEGNWRQESSGEEQQACISISGWL